MPTTSLSPEQRAQRARTAAHARWAKTTSEQRSAHGRAMARGRTDLDAFVRAIVDRAPELTAEQRARLAAILPPPPATSSPATAAA